MVVTDSAGCTDTLTVVVDDDCAPGGGGCVMPVVVSVATTPAYCGEPVGTASIELANDTVGFAYLWQPAVSAGPSASGLAAGTYEVRIADPADPDSCFVKVTLEIEGTDAPSLSATTTAASCDAGGAISLSANGGTPPYTYDWSDLPGMADPADRTDVAAGTYEVVVTDSAGCTDTLTVVVGDDCAPGGGLIDTLTIVTVMDTPTSFCPADSVAMAMSSMTPCGMPANGTFEMSDSCVLYIPDSGFTGQDSACLVVCDSMATCDTLIVLIEVTEVVPCEALFAEAQDTLWAADCAEAWYCIPVPFMELEDFEILDNGTLFGGSLAACDFDSLMAYTYTALPGGGYAGPYLLQQWEVDGQTYTANFEDIEALVALMNEWDPAGNWTLNTSTQTVTGGVPGRAYGDLVIRQISSGAIAVLTLNTNLTPQGTALLLASGQHELVVRDLTTGCADTVSVEVFCSGATTLVDTVGLNLTDTLCIDLSWLPGDSLSLQNICPDQSGEFVFIDFLPPDCIVVQGVEIGAEQACIVACDELGYCDTLTIQIEVVPMGDQPIANDDEGSTWREQDIQIEILLNDTINGELADLYLLDQPQFGTVTLDANGVAIYQPNGADCDPIQPDRFTYVLCNPVGCDTATVFVTVDCEEFIIFSGFSPNGDGVNDFFTIRGVERLPGNHLLVFNRWGNQVYEAWDYKNDWDGTWNGKKLPDGTYFYIFEDGRGNTFTGYVQINR